MGRKGVLPIFAILGIVILFFAPVLFTDKSFVFRDYYRYFYPTRYFAWESMRNGIIPLWNPYLYCGIPFLADLQSCIFYPPSIILYLLPFHFGLKFFCVLHFFLAGLFMYLLLREFSLERSACLAGAITFTLSGYLLSVVDMITSLTSAVWIPLVFLFFNRALREGRREKGGGKRFWYAILTGIALGMQFLGGEPTLLYATLLSLFFFAIAKGLSGVRNQESGVRSLFKRLLTLHSLPSTLYSLLVTCVIALGLVLFQALPFLEMVINSTRVQGDYSVASHWSLAPHELFGLIAPFPSIYGLYRPDYLAFLQAWLKNLYLGLIPLLLAVLAITTRRKITSFFAILGFGFIFLSFGDYLPGYFLIYKYLPIFYLIRYPVKFFSISTFALAVLAGFGFHYFIRSLRENKKGYPRWLLIFNILYLLLYIGGHEYQIEILGLLITTRFPNLPDNEIPGLISGYEQLLENIFFAGIILSMANLFGFLTTRRRIRPGLFGGILVILIMVDLSFFGVALNPLIGKEFYVSSPQTLRVVRKPGSLHRIMVTPMMNAYYRYLRGSTFACALERAKFALIANLGLRYHLFEIGGYTSLILRDYTDFLEFVQASNFKDAQPVLSLVNVRYLLSHWEIKEGKVNRVYDEGINVYENLTYLPRAFFVREAIVIKDRVKILERLFDPGFDSTKEIILEENHRLHRFSQISRTQNLKPIAHHPSPITQIVEYQSNRVIIRTSSQEPGFLFLSDTYYPGWEVEIDGVKTKVYRANYTFRAIELPAGEHLVEFVYRPTSFKVGALGSALILITLIGYGVWRREKD